MHSFLLITAGLTLGALSAPAHALSSAAATATQASRQTSEPREADPGDDLGGPLSVGGTEISEDQIRRYLIYGPCRSSMEYHRINAIINDEIQRRLAGYEDEMATWEAIKASGADPGPEPFKYTPEFFTVSDEDFEVHYESKMSAFRRKYPTLNEVSEIRRAYRALEWYRRELRQEMMFDLVLVPDDQAHWPDLTFEAMRAEAGEILIDDFHDSYERRKAFLETALAEWQAKVDAGEDAGPKPKLSPEDSMYRSILRQIVRDAVLGVTDSKTAIDGLDPGVLTTMDFDWDGKPELKLTTAEIWNDAKRFVTREEINQARTFLALVEATRQRLESEGKMLSDEAAAAHMDDVKSKFGSNFSGIGPMAVGAHGFPSVEAYAAYMPLLESYRISVAPQMESSIDGLAPVLREYLPIANQVMGLSKVDAEILLVSAFSWEEFGWIEGGWDAALKKAQWLRSEIEKNGVAYAEYRKKKLDADASGAVVSPEEAVMDPHDFWSRLIDEHSDFWDPPPPMEGKPGADQAYKKLGRFGERSRNDLRSLLGESPYLYFLTGGLLTDTVYFKTQIGSIAGPLRGPHGWYLAKVLKRTPPNRPLNVNDERHVQLLKDEWVRVSFITYAHESLNNAQVSGLNITGAYGSEK